MPTISQFSRLLALKGKPLTRAARRNLAREVYRAKASKLAKIDAGSNLAFLAEAEKRRQSFLDDLRSFVGEMPLDLPREIVDQITQRARMYHKRDIEALEAWKRAST